jgi:hypothetical protein
MARALLGVLWYVLKVTHRSANLSSESRKRKTGVRKLNAALSKASSIKTSIKISIPMDSSYPAYTGMAL